LGSCCGTVVFWGSIFFFLESCFLSKFYGCSLSFSYFDPKTHARWHNLSQRPPLCSQFVIAAYRFG
jgi:hypothetical protein